MKKEKYRKNKKTLYAYAYKGSESGFVYAYSNLKMAAPTADLKPRVVGVYKLVKEITLMSKVMKV